MKLLAACDRIRIVRLWKGCASTSQTVVAPVEIVSGYRTGLIGGRKIHARDSVWAAGLGYRFKRVVTVRLTDFRQRLDSPVNGVWTAFRKDEIVGSIAIDGENIRGEIEHLR